MWLDEGKGALSEHNEASLTCIELYRGGSHQPVRPLTVVGQFSAHTLPSSPTNL